MGLWSAPGGGSPLGGLLLVPGDHKPTRVLKMSGGVLLSHAV
ncbi:MAG: hypothetical protein JWM67_1810, partial [Mycobacterium sp.]|nr:hypothetical protein [Mycobacterium sp.]